MLQPIACRVVGVADQADHIEAELFVSTEELNETGDLGIGSDQQQFAQVLTGRTLRSHVGTKRAATDDEECPRQEKFRAPATAD